MQARPVLLALVAASGCVVSTSDLAPQTDAACAAGGAARKACGYRCVPVDDPATGCGVSGQCQPCAAPAGAHTVAACVGGQCGAACAPGYADCDGIPGNGCERVVSGPGATDVAHCGACGHACLVGATCTNGACTGVPVNPPFVTTVVPRDMVRDGSGNAYYLTVDPASLTTTAGVTWAIRGVPSHAAVVSGAGAATAAAYRAGTPAAFWVGAGDGADLVLVEAPVGAAAVAHSLGALAGASDAVDGLLVTPSGRLYATTFDWHQVNSVASHLFVWDLPAGPLAAVTYSGTTELHGLGGLSPHWYVGIPESGGSVVRMIEGAGTLTVANAVRTGVGATPTRLAGFTNGASQHLLFWAAQDDGSVWAADVNLTDGTLGAPTLVYGPTGATSRMDLASDADGVYWSDRTTGVVTMWRASDQAVLPLGFSASPYGLAPAGTLVYWTDDNDRAVYSAAK